MLQTPQPCPPVVQSQHDGKHDGNDDHAVASNTHGNDNNQPARKLLLSLSPAFRDSRAVHSVRYRVVVFTYLRPDGLRRILKSLAEARYPKAATVSLSILVDSPKKKQKGASAHDTSAANSQARAETLDVVRNFHWPHGPLTIHRREVNVGLKKNILESWYPPAAGSSADGGTGEEEMCALFEDDIEVSPFWFDWVTAAVDRYYFEQSIEIKEKLLGISLYRPIHDELSRKGCVVDNNHQPFLLQQPCSWGALYFPSAWRRFRDWYDEFEATSADPVVVTARGGEPDSNTWPRSSSWKKYLIKFMHEQGLAMVYPNLPASAVFATNHLMKGEHPLPNRKLFELPLLDEKGARQIWNDYRSDEGVNGKRLIEPDSLPSLEDLKKFDVMFDQHEAAGGDGNLLGGYLSPKQNAAALRHSR